MVSSLWFTIFLLCFPSSVVVSQQLCHEAVDVLIVGAGMSGLSAADRLQKRAPELTFKVIESTDIVGGRVRTVDFGGEKVEVGAGWARMEDFGANAVPLLLNSYNIATFVQDFFDFTIFSRQEGIVTAVADQAVEDARADFTAASNCLDAFLEERLYNDDGMDDPEDIGFVAGLNDSTLRLPTCPAVWQASTPFEQFIEWNYIDYEFAEPDTSFYSLPYFDAFAGNVEIPLVTGGYANLPQKFAEDIFETSQLEGMIDFNTKATKIEYDFTGAQGSSVKTTVQNDGGSSCDHYLSNYVVLTVSMGVLQNGGISFEPPLVRQPLESPYTFPVYQRIYYKFSEALGSTAYEREFLGTYDVTNYNERCHQWQNFGAPGIDKGNIWMCTILDDVVKAMAAENSEVGGATLSNIQIDGLLDGLRAVFPENAGAMAFNNYDFFFPDQLKEESFGFGSFENWKKGATELDDFFPFFGGGLLDQYCDHNGCDSDGNWRLHFSGSASCWDYYGLVDGAYYAGERSVEFILYDMGITEDYDNAFLGRCEDDLDYLQGVFDQRNGNDDCNIFFLFVPFCIIWKAILAIWNAIF